MRRAINLLVISLVFLMGAAVGYGIGFTVWAMTPGQVARLQAHAQHLTEKAFGIASDHATPARHGG